MPKHSDDEPVKVCYSSSRNISFENRYSPDDLGYTWREWREMSDKEQAEAIQDYANELVDVYVVEDES